MAKQPAKPPAPRGAEGDLDILRHLVSMLDGSSVTRIRFKRGEASYEVSREGLLPLNPALALPPMGAHLQPHPVAPGQAAAAGGAAAAAPSPGLIEIKSPMVGTFYRAPEPGAEPYVKPGSRVAPGQTLCIIEAMKIMNELESEVSGVVREILVEDAQPVEFGQVLFRVEP